MQAEIDNKTLWKNRLKLIKNTVEKNQSEINKEHTGEKHMVKLIMNTGGK